jgi:protein-S-isoprenylcysteine O-methyltransferase Ste14
MAIWNEIIVACWGVFILYWVYSSFFVKKDALRTQFWWSWWFRIVLIGVLVTWIAHTGHLGKIPQLEIFQSNGNAVLGALGALFCVVGIGLAVWARVHLGSNWSPAPTLKEGHELVTSGPYRWLRHPIYTGMLLAILGSTFSSTEWIIVLVMGTAVFVWRIGREEALMMQQFPSQYPEYKKHTWALIPFIY